jgi:hypothetical protein
MDGIVQYEVIIELGADPEERNEQGMTAFHLAMKLGHIPIVKYFFDTYPPRDSDYSAIYQCFGCDNLLSLALGSRKTELVCMVLEKGLATKNELTQAWTWASSKSGQLALRGKATASDLESADDIMELLKKYDESTLSKEIKPEGEAADKQLPKTADADLAAAAAAAEQPRLVNPTANNAQKKSSVHVRGQGRGKRQNRGQPSRPNH